MGFDQEGNMKKVIEKFLLTGVFILSMFLWIMAIYLMFQE